MFKGCLHAALVLALCRCRALAPRKVCCELRNIFPRYPQQLREHLRFRIAECFLRPAVLRPIPPIPSPVILLAEQIIECLLRSAPSLILLRYPPDLLTKCLVLVLETLEQAVECRIFLIQSEGGVRVEAMKPQTHRPTAPKIINTVFGV